MPNRLIKETIRTSKRVNALSDFQFRIWIYLITYVDDYGRGSADPELLKGFVFPRKKGITEQQIADALDSLANSGMINLYESDGESYFCFPNWEQHQQIRAKRSKFPEPDNSGYHLISDDIRCSRNPIQSNPNPNSNPNAPAHTHEEETNDLGRVMTFFFDKVNPSPSPTCIDMLKGYTASLGADVVLHVLGIALDERKTAWSYIRAILARYERDGLKDLQAVLDAEQRHNAQKEPTEAEKPAKQRERPVDILNDLVEYPYGSGKYRPRWEVPDNDGT